MVTQTTQTLPPPFITAIGEDFSSFLTGKKPIQQFPFFTDPSSYLGPEFVAPQDALTGQAIAAASGLGGFQPFLE